MNADLFNKVAGALLGAFLVFLLLNFTSQKIYDTRPIHGGHHEPLGFALELDSGDTDTVEEDTGPDYAALLASADASAGEKVFNKCKSCHKIEEGANGVGPHLWDLMGRKVAGVDGYSY